MTGSAGNTGAGGTTSGGTTISGGSTGQTSTGGATGNGGNTATGGTKSTGGAPGTGGTTIGTGGSTTVGSGGRSTLATGGAASGGTIGTGGGNPGGLPGSTGGAGPGGTTGIGGRAAGGTAGGGNGGGAGGGTGGSSGSPGTGTCTASKAASQTVTGTGPHKVVIETNADAGIKCGTIFRPADLGTEKYPIFVWGEGGCSQDGLSNRAAMGEIASHGYFIVADGTPGGTNSCAGGQDGKAFLDYITWAIAENGKSCSAYFQALDTAKVAADGFSCGGLMAENVSGDPRFAAVGITSSGLFSADQALYKKIHTPFKILLGGSGDMAYTNGERDYDSISALGIPILLFSKDGAGHGGDLGNAKGDFNTVNLAWLNWQLKGDTGATGRGLLDGASCKYCTASGWEYKSKNIQ